MKLIHLPITFSGLLIWAPLLAANDVAVPTLGQIEAVRLDSIINQTQGGIKWSHSAFLLEDGGPGGKTRTFYTLNREGRMVSSATAEIPDAAYMSVGDFDRQDDNSIVFIGQARSAYGDATPFIGLVSADGRTQTIMRVAPYHPYMLSVAPDGTFWTIGFEMVDRNLSALELNPNAGVLRHFDRSGKLLVSSGSQSQFVNLFKTTRLDYGYITATADRIGWYAPRSGTGGQYVEIETESMTVHTYPGLPELPVSSLVVCFSLTGSGNAFLSVYDNAAQRSTTFMFDRAKLKWQTLKESTVSSLVAGRYLIGVDGEQLVFRDWDSSAVFLSLSH